MVTVGVEGVTYTSNRVTPSSCNEALGLPRIHLQASVFQDTRVRYSQHPPGMTRGSYRTQHVLARYDEAFVTESPSSLTSI